MGSEAAGLPGHLTLPALFGREFRLEDCTRDADGFLVNSSTCSVPFWYTRTGFIVKWVLFLGFATIFGLYLLLGYLHAKRRVRKGLKPLAYHRWLVNRTELARVDPAYASPPAGVYPAPYGGPGADQRAFHTMQSMPPPVYDPARPPMYDQTRPPMYFGPSEGVTKVDPSQTYAAPAPPNGGGGGGGFRHGDDDRESDFFSPPPGAPPPPSVSASASARLAAQTTGGSTSTNPFLDPAKR